MCVSTCKPSLPAQGAKGSCGPSREPILHPNLAPKILTLVQGDPKVSRHLTMVVAVTRKGSSHLEGPPTLPRALQL